MKFILIFTSIIYLSLSNIYCLAEEVKEGDSLKVGLIVPLSGKNQEIGKSVLNSIRLALSKINANQLELLTQLNHRTGIDYSLLMNLIHSLYSPFINGYHVHIEV